MLRRIRRNLREEAKSLPSYDESPTPIHTLVMNIIVWNYRGAMKPFFQNHVKDLVNNHELAILIVMETKIGGNRAHEITSRLPFDGAIHTDTIGYAGGFWMLWNFDKVEISPLSNAEQEIQVTIMVQSSNSSWILSAIYASPRSVKRHILWKIFF